MLSPVKFEKTNQGFTLIELMVGMTIGMLATIVIMQVFSTFEGQKRTTTGSADAQTNGSIALYTLSREVQMAGYPLMPNEAGAPLDCNALGGTLPITIDDSAANSSDRLAIRYGDSSYGGVPSKIDNSNSTGNNEIEVQVTNSFGCQLGDFALIQNGTACSLATVNGINPSLPPAPGSITLAGTFDTVTGYISCLGQWKEITYSSDGTHLIRDESVNGGTTESQPNISGIVNLQAQYGVADTANSNVVTRWVNAKNLADWNEATDGPVTDADWGNQLSADNRKRIKVIRIAVVARNSKKEPSSVTNACSSITASTPAGLCSWEGSLASPAPTIDLSHTSDWRQYRYRVFETIVPLRNIIWSKESFK